MRQIFVTIFAFIFGLLFVSSGCVQAQCTETEVPKVLLIGDSWAFFMSVDMTINRALEKWGHSNYTYVTNAILAENGAETDDFLKPEKQDEILAQLQANPSIEVIHVSIGGNDILGDWNVNFTQGQTDTLEQEVYDRMMQIFDFLKQAKPGIRILWSGYTYTNFEEVIEDFAPFQTNHPFYDTWEGMGFPSFQQINAIQMHFADQMEAYCQTDPQVDYINIPAILQYTFGQNGDLGVPPGGSYAPLTAPLPYGFPDYPSPKSSMRDYGLTKDCFHLSPQGYDDLIGYNVRKFYHKVLMGDQYFLAENSENNGSISNSGIVSEEIRLGEGQSAILSFNTSGLLNETIGAASIFLRRESLNGSNPANTPINLQIVSGYLGGNEAIEPDDATAVGDTMVIPCRFGSNDGNEHWWRLDLPEAALSFIQNSPVTQFMLSVPDFIGGEIQFSNTNEPDFAPVLSVDFSAFPVGIPPQSTKDLGLNVYPNPANDFLYFSTRISSNFKVIITDMNGRYVSENEGNQHRINIASLPSGIYRLTVLSEEGVEGTTFCKAH